MVQLQSLLERPVLVLANDGRIIVVKASLAKCPY